MCGGGRVKREGSNIRNILPKREEEGGSFNAELFELDIFPIFFVSRFFFSVPDPVWRSKFLFPFSSSSRERFPWFKYV